MDAERYRDLIVRRALGEATEQERAEIEDEIERRGEAGRDEADLLREVVGSLGLAASPRTPPPALRARILDALPARPGTERTPSADATSAAATPITSARSDPSAAGRERSARLWPWVAVAATLAAIALGLNSIRLQGDLASARAELTTAEQGAAQADALRDSLSGLVRDVSTLIDANPVTLSATSPDVVGRARVFVDVDTGRTLLLVDDLPVLPPEQVYQLWSIRDGQPTDAGAFRLEREGPAWIELAESTNLEGVDLLAVTVEQAPGAPAPTTSPILAGGI